MLKRILVLLGETKSSAVARRYALRLAAIKGARIVGLAGVDRGFIEATMIGGIGTAALQASIERELSQAADDARQRLHDSFELECKDRNIAFEWQTFDGDPLETLCHASETCDLVVTGHDTGFCSGLQESVSRAVTELLQLTPRPVMVCPDEDSAQDDVLIAYDGSVPAARAVQIFALLGVGTTRRILVTSVDADIDVAARKVVGAVAYLRMHGFEAEANPIRSIVDPTEVLRKVAAERQIGTLVMGAYGHRGLREYFFGSTTSALVETPPCPLFLYH